MVSLTRLYQWLRGSRSFGDRSHQCLRFSETLAPSFLISLAFTRLYRCQSPWAISCQSVWAAPVNAGFNCSEYIIPKSSITDSNVLKKHSGSSPSFNFGTERVTEACDLNRNTFMQSWITLSFLLFSELINARSSREVSSSLASSLSAREGLLSLPPPPPSGLASLDSCSTVSASPYDVRWFPCVDWCPYSTCACQGTYSCHVHPMNHVASTYGIQMSYLHYFYPDFFLHIPYVSSILTMLLFLYSGLTF